MRCIKNELNEKQYETLKLALATASDTIGREFKLDKGLLRDGSVAFRVSLKHGEGSPFCVYLTPNKKELHIHKILYKEA